MKARAKRAVSEQAIEPSPERRRHGRIERVSRQIADQRGDPARPFRAVDTLAAMERHGTITSSMRQAADDFRRDFQIAGLDTLRAMPLTRLGGSGGALSDARLDARRRVHRALTGLGGPGSPAGSCLWHIVGLEQTLKGWALREGWSGRPIGEKTAAGVLIAALGALAQSYGYG
jgi:hypothetical protein